VISSAQSGVTQRAARRTAIPRRDMVWMDQELGD
jgi:hypothetical protein